MKALFAQIEKIETKIQLWKEIQEKMNASNSESVKLSSKNPDECARFWQLNHLWCNLYDEQQKVERSIKASIRKFAKDHGFVIKEDINYMSGIETVVDSFRGRIEAAERAFHDTHFCFGIK